MHTDICGYKTTKLPNPSKILLGGYTQYFSCNEKNTIILIGVQEQQLCQKTSTLFNDDKCMRKKILFQLTDSKKSAIYPQHCTVESGIFVKLSNNALWSSFFLNWLGIKMN